MWARNSGTAPLLDCHLLILRHFLIFLLVLDMPLERHTSFVDYSDAYLHIDALCI
jgi:hypothetical protein